jgi:hypothetical protein
MTNLKAVPIDAATTVQTPRSSASSHPGRAALQAQSLLGHFLRSDALRWALLVALIALDFALAVRAALG